MSISAVTSDPRSGDAPAAAAWTHEPLLASVLEAAAQAEPDRTLFTDQPGRAEWSGRPSHSHTRSEAARSVRQLARLLAGLGLPPGAHVAICLPGGSEACLAFLAIERAGLVPCVLPLDAPAAGLAALVEAADVRAVVTQARFGELRPAQQWCEIAAGYFRLRFLLAFGPEVPDGVVDLDRALADGPARSASPAHARAPEPGLVTFQAEGGMLRPVHRSCRSLVASAATLFAAVKIRPDHRILSLVAGDDLKGLATGLVAALMSGAALETHELFDARTLLAAMEAPVPTHVVSPGWAETKLASIAGAARSTILVHDVPVHFGTGGGLSSLVVDVVAFGETALLAVRRTPGGTFTFTVAHLSGTGVPSDLFDVRLGEGGEIEFRGLAAAGTSLPRDTGLESDAPDLWRKSGHAASIFAGIPLGIT